MPEVHTSPASNPSHQRQDPKQRRPRHPCGFGPSLLGESSPTLPGSTTTEHEMLFWVGLFYRLHQRRKRLIPVQLRTLDRPVIRGNGSLVISSDGQPVRMRCLREVALHEARGQVTWQVIEYAAGLPSLRFCRCASLEEAMARFEAEPEPVRL